LPFNPETDIPFFKQAALAILKTGIIGENGLKGHAGHKKDFPVNVEYLIVDLVDKHYNYTDVNFFPGDILNIFDGYFDNMATLARFAGITDKKIDNVNKILQIWRDKISQALSQGNFPANWRELVREELISSYKYHPKTKAEAFAVVFLRHAPQASDNRIATWSNDVLKSLSDSTVSKSKLREYIKKERKLRPYLTQNLSKNPL
jgi:hypothetical protein